MFDRQQYNHDYYLKNKDSELARVKSRHEDLAVIINDYKRKRKCYFATNSKRKCQSLNSDKDGYDDNAEAKQKVKRRAKKEQVGDDTPGDSDSKSYGNRYHNFNQGYVKLEFHHKDPSTKFKAISDMVYQGYSLQRIMDEIKKCILVCRECHVYYYHSG